MATDKKVDPAAAFLEEHGEEIRNGGRNGNMLKVTATDLAESAPQIKKAGGKKGAGINLRKVAEVLESYGMDPTEEIIRVLPDLEPDLKARVFLDLLQYTQPKLKAVEVTGKDGGPINQVGTFNINFGGKRD